MIIKKSELKLVPANELPLYIAEEVDFIKVDAPMLTNVMLDRMTEMGGVALSAPQVGLDMSMFVMCIDQARVEVFNPTIISYSKEETLMNEGSLTFPGISVIIKRPVSITVEYYNICNPCPIPPIPKPGVAFGGTENIVGFEATQAYRYQVLVSLAGTARGSGTTRIINTQLNQYGYVNPPPPPRNRFG